MNGRWIPEDVLAEQPWYVNFGENPITVHFLHRVLALAAAVAVAAAWWRWLRPAAADRARRAGPDRWLGHALLLALAAQVALGAATAMAGVPLVPALLHQAGADGPAHDLPVARAPAASAIAMPPAMRVVPIFAVVMTGLTR